MSSGTHLSVETFLCEIMNWNKNKEQETHLMQNFKEINKVGGKKTNGMLFPSY